MVEAISSWHGATDSSFWHYRQTGRFLKLCWGGAEEVPSNVTNLQGHAGNYKTLTIAESQIWIMEVFLVVLCLSLFLIESLILRKERTLGSYPSEKKLIKPKLSSCQLRGKIHRKMLFCLRWRKKSYFLVVIDIQEFGFFWEVLSIYLSENPIRRNYPRLSFA